jgi:nucleoside-diphosphate kinase
MFTCFSTHSNNFYKTECGEKSLLLLKYQALLNGNIGKLIRYLENCKLTILSIKIINIDTSFDNIKISEPVCAIIVYGLHAIKICLNAKQQEFKDNIELPSASDVTTPIILHSSISQKTFETEVSPYFDNKDYCRDLPSIKYYTKSGKTQNNAQALPFFLIPKKDKQQVERTLIIIRGDAVARKIVGEIIEQLERHQLRVTNIKTITFNEELIHAFYGMHKTSIFYKKLINYLSYAYHLALVLEGENAIAISLCIKGNNPKTDTLNTIRKKYGIDKTQCTMHCSDNKAQAEREISLCFSPQELALSSTATLDEKLSSPSNDSPYSNLSLFKHTNKQGINLKTIVAPSSTNINSQPSTLTKTL